MFPPYRLTALYYVDVVPPRRAGRYANISQHNHNERRGWGFDDPWITRGIDRRRSQIHGRGLFTKSAIPPGETVMILNGLLFSVAAVRAGKAREDSVTGYCEGYYIGSPVARPKSLDEYLNHSCNPNLWLVDALTIVARTYIEPDQELTFDYSTWEIDEQWNLGAACNCLEAECRKTITGKDWRLASVQDKYGDHILPCLQQRTTFEAAGQMAELI